MAKLSHGYRGGSARLLAFICGVIESQIAFYAELVTPNWQTILRFGLEWVLLFELVYRLRTRLRSRTVPIFIAGVWVILPILSSALLLLPVLGVDGPLRSQVIAYYSNPVHVLPSLTIFPHNLLGIARSAAFVTVSYFLIYRCLPWGSATQQTGASWTGCERGSMSPSKSQTTRLLCASAFLAGSGFRDQVLNYLKNETHGVSPELGLDLRLVATVCQYVRQRSRRFELYMFFAVLVAGAIAIFVDPTLAIAVFVLAEAGIYFKKDYGDRIGLVSNFHKETFDDLDPEKLFAADLDPEAMTALPSEDQNLVVYTGFSPFIGAGANLGGWSFVVDISKPSSNVAHSGEPVPFKISEIYEALVQKITDSQIDGLVIKDFFFVSGREIRTDREILPDMLGRPVQHLDSELAQKYVTESDARVRHYKWIRVHDWGHELVMSHFLRCSLRGSSMFVEINRLLLTPLADQYRRIDAMKEPGAGAIMAMLIAAVMVGPIYGLVTPLLLLSRFNEAVGNLLGGKEKTRRRTIEDNPLFDYGAGQGFRQALSSGQFAHYFQKADADFYMKMLGQAMLDGVITFLDEHEIDTSDLRERQTMIMNSGIIVQGGDLSAESLAVGAGAQANKTEAPRKPKSKGAAA